MEYVKSRPGNKLRSKKFSKINRTILLFALCFVTMWNVLGQQGIQVTGAVSDNFGESLPGVNVAIKGTTQGTSTDEKGEFTLTVPDEKTVLQFTFIGYKTQELTVGNRRIIPVAMTEDVASLEEVTIVAFGKQKKESVIAAVSTIRPADLKVPSSNLTTSLAGRIAGLISYQRSGEPGRDNAAFFIRGVTTFGYKKDPLILIDNNEMSAEDLARIQPDDIESFSIMKDATATALYGSRGANGVILVTTKEGHEGQALINIRFENSTSMPTRMVKLADPITYMLLHNEAVKTRDPLGVTLYSQNKIDRTMAGGNPYVYPANDWYDLLFRDYTMNQRVNFNLSGGGPIARYYIAGTFNNDNGVFKVDKMNNFNNNINLKRYMLRTNFNINVTKTTEVAFRLSGTFDNLSGPPLSGDDMYKLVMRTNPVLFPPYYKPDENNEFTKHILYGNYDKAQFNNPYAQMTRGYRDYVSTQMSAQFELNQKLDFVLPGLFFKGMFNTSRNSEYNLFRQYNPFYYAVSRYDLAKDEYMLYGLNETSGTEYLSYGEGEKKLDATTYAEGSLNWQNSFDDKHDVSALLVGTMRERTVGNAGSLQASLPFRNLGLAGRFTYAYNSRYFGEFNFGYNGSERFAIKERFGFFPSAGLGWYVSNEAFWGDKLNRIVNKLKFKGTYGLVGNDAIGDETDRFFYLSEVEMNSSSRGAYFGTYGNFDGSNYLSGVSIYRYANDLITWETARKLNVGMELGLFNKIEIQWDVFSEQRYNILMTRASIPGTMGLQAPIRANVGRAEASGTDISIDFNHFFNKDFWMTGKANFTYAHSKYTKYEEPDYSDNPWRSHVGYSLKQEWGFVAERLFVDEYEVDNSPPQFGTIMGGDIKYKDINGDGRITEMDMVPIGYPSDPEIVYGFGLSAGYKYLDVSCFFQGLARESFWIDAGNTSPFISQQNALLKAYADDHWSEENRNIYALWPRLSDYRVENNVGWRNTWFMRDGSFLRLKQVEIGYTLPEHILKKIYFANFRIYFNGVNLLTFSKFKMWDPEMGGDGLGYPIQKVFNVGLQFGF